MDWQNVIEVIKLVVPGIVGGLIAHWLGARAFQSQKRFETKHEDDLKRRDALREIYNSLETVFVDILRDWKMPDGSKETSKQHIARLVGMVDQAEVLFLGDPEMTSVLNGVRGLIGADFNFFLKPGKELDEIIERARKKIENRILQLEKSLH